MGEDQRADGVQVDAGMAVAPLHADGVFGAGTHEGFGEGAVLVPERDEFPAGSGGVVEAGQVADDAGEVLEGEAGIERAEWLSGRGPST